MREQINEEYREPSKLKSFINNVTAKILSVNVDVDEEEPETEYEYEENEAAVQTQRNEYVRRYDRAPQSANVRKPTSNVVKFNKENKKTVEITNPANLEEAARVVDLLNDDTIVTINLEAIGKKEAQHIADFVCGAAYAINAEVGRISAHIFIVTPNGMGMSGGKKEIEDADEYEFPKVVSYR